ncbi:DUF805 domain-containing protein [Pelagibacterium sp. 26DY04]|uniref:DUF805 domain-containing protein n=1 Tax=Pelagibacterium sp. 26DY04 TaxID=2967130 RepID=UPI0028150721|nr:DUF805 domain-containing protein [Pelagibacterium sp. 26DY04]WMT87806.1 DUF805 domain-containing protein [Pelagibacterium sp. 26DY04]
MASKAQMGIVDAVKTCFRKYADFSGRASRPEYWWFFLFTVIVTAILGILDAAIFGSGAEIEEAPRILSGIFQLAVLLPMLAVAWRRMHDTGRPGWYVLLPMLLSFAFLAAALAGVVTFSAVETRLDDPSVLIAPAAWFGGFGVALTVLVQLVLALLMLWWLTRPSQPGANQYGPAPAK